jgi:hypothetical protein
MAAKWVVHCAPAGHGPQALSYLSRYIYKTAISSARLVSQDDQSVTFTYRDSTTRRQNTCTLASEEFLRRFLQHVLPKGFQRVRHYGWLGPAAKQTFARISVLLAVSVTASRQRSGLTVVLLCPHCQKPLRRVADIARAPP